MNINKDTPYGRLCMAEPCSSPCLRSYERGLFGRANKVGILLWSQGNQAVRLSATHQALLERACGSLSFFLSFSLYKKSVCVFKQSLCMHEQQNIISRVMQGKKAKKRKPRTSPSSNIAAIAIRPNHQIRTNALPTFTLHPYAFCICLNVRDSTVPGYNPGRQGRC